MDQTSPDNMNNCRITDEHFTPIAQLKNPHLQTLLPRILRRIVRIKPCWQRLELPDGDFVDLAWSEDPEHARHKPRAVIFHGLEGSINSPYAHGLLSAIKKQGWLGVVMHFRGCGKAPNRMTQSYHSGEIGDASYFLQWLQETYGKVPTAAIGFSLGGNMLACLMGSQGSDCLLDAGVIVSAPLMLEPCSSKLEQGFSRFYQFYLLSQLKKSARRKMKAYPELLSVSPERLKQIHRLRDFDDEVTSKIHGFADATDYYRRASGMPMLSGVEKPLLIIHAQDDPFMVPDVIPNPEHLSPSITYQLSQYGGHVGFVSGTLTRPVMWLEKRIPQWLSTWLDKKA
ncbi:MULTISPECIES: hydrolase [Tatumella]|nr:MULTISPECIES: hydrolase [Tatumella]SQK71702.1 putative hydrolase [Tatumella ptyseos]